MYVIVKCLALELLSLLISADVRISEEVPVVKHVDDVLTVNLARHLLVLLLQVCQPVFEALHLHWGVVSGEQLRWRLGLVLDCVHVHRGCWLAETLELLRFPGFRTVGLGARLDCFPRFFDVVVGFGCHLGLSVSPQEFGKLFSGVIRLGSWTHLVLVPCLTSVRCTSESLDLVAWHRWLLLLLQDLHWKRPSFVNISTQSLFFVFRLPLLLQD